MKTYLPVVIVILGVAFVQGMGSVDSPSDAKQLGEELFFDPILSKDFTVSCASCHNPAFAFSDTSVVSTGVEGRAGHRNTPTVMNILLRQPFFWDGRASTLEEQALMPIENHVEMDLPIDEAVERLRKSAYYSKSFTKVFQKEPSRELLAAAIAAFERSLETIDSPFDRWQMMDDSAAVNAEVKKGFDIFNDKGNCITCHFGSDFTTNEFRNIGLFDGGNLNDSGRYLITKNPGDLGKFKTPTLRNVSITGPYMHNGMFKTLDEVIEFYNDPDKIVPGAVNRDTLLAKPLNLTVDEKKALKAFLISLTDKQFLTGE